MPATQMSAPESGRTCTVACPFTEDMCALIVGAGSKDSVAMVGTTRDSGGGSRRLRKALAKWPIF